MSPLNDRDRNPAELRSGVVCELAEVTYRQLDYWCRLGLFGEHEHMPGSGGRRRFTPEDLRLAQVLGALTHHLPNVLLDTVGPTLRSYVLDPRLTDAAHQVAVGHGWAVVFYGQAIEGAFTVLPVPALHSEASPPASVGDQRPPAGAPAPHEGSAALVGPALTGPSPGDAPTLETVPELRSSGAPHRDPQPVGAVVGATSP